jgi:phage recombination protein Bet
VTEAIQTTNGASRSIVETMAQHFGMEREAFQKTLMETVMPGGKATPAQVAAFLVVAQKHGLNPFTRELFAFPDKGGGIRPIVSIDGWARIINDNPAFDGLELVEVFDDANNFVAVTCQIHRKDRSHPIVVTEYLKECDRGTEPWKRWPKRMLRHKALIQCARLAFSFSGIVDQDEYEREIEAKTKAVDATVIPGEPALDRVVRLSRSPVAASEPATAAQDLQNAFDDLAGSNSASEAEPIPFPD